MFSLSKFAKASLKCPTSHRCAIRFLSPCAQSQPTRSLSSTSAQYEYPNRNEAPIITRSNAKENVSSATDDSRTRIKDKSRLTLDDVDKFDDRKEFSSTERDEIREKQKREIKTSLSPLHKIMPTKPDHIPPNIQNSKLDVPETMVTTLSNGLRVVSQETYGQVTTVGVLADFGSRLETNETRGVNHLLELLAFQSMHQYPNSADVVAKMDALGGTTFAQSSREQMMYCVDVLRPNVEASVEILAGTILSPIISYEEVEQVKQVVQFQHMDMPPELKMGEGLQIAGYKDQQLGMPHLCPPEALSHLNPSVIQSFRAQNLSASKMVLAAAGIEHEKLVELGERYFSSIPPTDPSFHVMEVKPSIYSGGEFRLEQETVEGHTKVALAFEVGGWHSGDLLVPTCVLQILLGGGNSFSAGGPGKGMYSRLYREVLNKYYWAESAESFTSLHSETGLFGISGSSKPENSRDLTRVITEHFAKLTTDLVKDEEIDRARNMLKCNVLSQLESRLVLFEDIGRQILTYGKRESVEEMCKKIDAVTAEDLREIARKAVSTPPTISTVGDDISKVPTHEELASWFQN